MVGVWHRSDMPVTLASVQENRASLAVLVGRLLQTVTALWQYCTIFVSWRCQCTNVPGVREHGGYIPSDDVGEPSSMENRRSCPRTRFASRVRIEHPEHGAAIFSTVDMSDGGVYVENGSFELRVGDLVTLQVQDLPGDAPLVRMRVVRHDDSGCGLQFAD
jgi:hypothetical protein